MRVANKGLVFVADIDIAEKQVKNLEKCCKILKHIGVGRTRGLGEVKIKLLNDIGENSKKQNAQLVEGATELVYEIELLESAIFKSNNGGEQNTQDYIEGSKVLGLIAQNIKEDYLSFIKKGELKCTNAYISKDGKRYTEVPGYLYSIKNNKSEYINKLYETKEKKDDSIQLNQIKHKYAYFPGENLELIDVVTEKRYHHRRPEDKSIGRAKSGEDNNADFYHMESVFRGQSFRGMVLGSEGQIKEVFDIFTKDKPFYMGYSRSSEYGKVNIKVVETKKTEQIDLKQTQRLLVQLISPTIIYNDKAIASTSLEDLKKEIIHKLQIGNAIKVVPYLKYVTLGGWNVTWHMRKPTISAFDKGTAILLEFSEPITCEIDSVMFIGERTAEGYGEVLIQAVSEEGAYRGRIANSEKTAKELRYTVEGAFSQKLCEALFDSYLRKQVLLKVEEVREMMKSKASSYKPTVSNMLLMAGEFKTLEEVEVAVKERYDKPRNEGKSDKNEAAQSIIVAVKRLGDVADTFMAEYKIDGFRIEKEKVMMKCLKEYLTHAKYALRDNSVTKREGGANE